jgi:hypothetical protein
MNQVKVYELISKAVDSNTEALNLLSRLIISDELPALPNSSISNWTNLRTNNLLQPKSNAASDYMIYNDTHHDLYVYLIYEIDQR